jgi:hypothetical protein
VNETSKKDQEKLIADNCELKKEVEVQRQILHLSDIAWEEVAKKEPNYRRRWKSFLRSCPHR